MNGQFHEIIKERLLESNNITDKLMASPSLLKEVENVVKEIVKVYRKDGKVILFGNGGSAADAQHISAELMGKYYLDRDSLPAIALTVNTSNITALSNDYSFATVFSKQLEGVGKAGDVAIGISTSGDSENVVQALKKANQLNLTTVGLTGGSEGKATEVVDYCLRIPSRDTPRVQEAHITVGHIICELVEKELFADSSSRAVFLDRDGVINEKAPEGEYIKSWGEFKFLPRAKQAVKMLNKLGFKVLLVTNQRGIAKGLMDEGTLREIHQNMKNELEQVGAHVDAIYHCPHEKNKCNCRKPDTGMFEKAKRDFPEITLEESFTVGDSLADIQAGNTIRSTTILINDSEENIEDTTADYIASSLFEAAEKINVLSEEYSSKS